MAVSPMSPEIIEMWPASWLNGTAIWLCSPPSTRKLYTTAKGFRSIRYHSSQLPFSYLQVRGFPSFSMRPSWHSSFSTVVGHVGKGSDKSNGISQRGSPMLSKFKLLPMSTQE